jgi:hypothetical protein
MHSEVSAFFYTGLVPDMKKPFHPQAQILGEPPLTWYLFLLFLIYRGKNNQLRSLCKIDGSGCLW